MSLLHDRTRPRWRRRLAPLGAALLASIVAPGLGAFVLGCTTNLEKRDFEPQPDPPVSGGTLVFDDASTLKATPGTVEMLSVTAAPPGSYQVKFSLIGSAFDGSLDQTVVTTDAEGHGSVLLNTPSQAATFRVRASLLDALGDTGASAERSVAVSLKGYASVSVLPLYQGHRSITTWTASVVSGVTCASLASALPNEAPGAFSADAPAGSQPTITSVPIGNLAVTVRAGHFAWGCTDAVAVSPGKLLQVPVTVVDKPIDLSAADLTLTLGYQPDKATYPSLLSDAAAALGEAFMPSGSNEGTVLLNSMQALAASADAASFVERRIDKSWDGLAVQHFAAVAPTLRAACIAWASAGAATASTKLQAMVGPGADAGEASVAVTQFGNGSADAAGAIAIPGFTWSTQPDDTVQLSGAIAWEPTRFVGTSALAPAQSAHPSAATVSAALAQEADCHGLATTLGGFGTCDPTCVEQLCTSAIASRWAAALGASRKAGTLGKLVVKASANTTVGDAAEPLSLNGVWLGQIDDGTVSSAITGAITGTGTPQPPP